MKNTNLVTTLLKTVALIVVDVISLLFVFSVWMLDRYLIFPYAIMAVVIGLLALNGTILLSKNISDTVGTPISLQLTTASTLFYLAIMVLTALTHRTITDVWYIILVLVVLLVYTAAVTAIYIAGKNNQGETARREQEKFSSAQVNSFLNDISSRVESTSSFLQKEDYSNVCKHAEKAIERMKFGTPFGRVNTPAVIAQEQQIMQRLQEINGCLDTLSTSANVTGLNSMFEDLYSLAVNKEKLIIGQ